MSDLHKEVLRNAFKQAATVLTLFEIQMIMIEALHELTKVEVKIIEEEVHKKQLEIYHGLSDEADAKQIDDAQRYRDHKND